MARLDPFTILYDAIVAHLKTKGVNVVDWNSSRGPQPDVPATSDMPEFQVRPTGMSLVLGARSCATEVTRDFAVVLNTNDFRVGRYLFPGEWTLTKAVHDLQYGALDALSYLDRRFVESCIITGSVSGVIDPATGRNIVGWSSLWTIRVRMSFSPSDMTGT